MYGLGRAAGINSDRKRKAGHALTLGSYPSTLGEIDALGFTKLDSPIGAKARLVGLSIAARIVNFKVIRRTKNPTTLGFAEPWECQFNLIEPGTMLGSSVTKSLPSAK